MSPEYHDGTSMEDLDARLARLEGRIDDLHDRLGTHTRGGGGIGCFGFVLFLILYLRIDEVLEAVTALGS